jgi:hypothetical protein
MKYQIKAIRFSCTLGIKDKKGKLMRGEAAFLPLLGCVLVLSPRLWFWLV